ncbi:hypothetical protein [Streptomyces sp. RB17]|nr:hypothetical protein [Streptomyces sp. RB17]
MINIETVVEEVVEGIVEEGDEGIAEEARIPSRKFCERLCE